MFSLYPMHQQGSPCCYNSLIVILSYSNNPIGKLHAENISIAVLPRVFKIAFPAYLSLVNVEDPKSKTRGKLVVAIICKEFSLVCKRNNGE